MEPANVELTTENVINSVQNKPLIADSIINATACRGKTFSMAKNLRTFRREKVTVSVFETHQSF